jgi:hypothetical protein
MVADRLSCPPEHICIPVALFGHLISRLHKAETEVKATRALMGNPNLTPAQKVVGYNTLTATGAAPGRPSVSRPNEHMPVTIGSIARSSGLSKNQAGTQIQTLELNGLLRKHRTYERLEDEGGQQTGKPRVRTRISLAPPDGERWTQTWGNRGATRRASSNLSRQRR